MERNVLSLLVANHFGVLTRVTNLFGQRGFNIDSLAVGETENPRFSRITITTHGDERVINQIKLQLAKLFGITGASLWRVGTIPAATGYDVWSAIRAAR